MNNSLCLNADFLRDLSVVAEDEGLLAKAVKYIRKLAAKKEDPTLMTKEEFFAHVDENGHATKPFELPSEDPDYHRQFMRCYNIPEFMTGPVTITPQAFADVLKGVLEVPAGIEPVYDRRADYREQL